MKIADLNDGSQQQIIVTQTDTTQTDSKGNLINY